jgi:hypothetical protein
MPGDSQLTELHRYRQLFLRHCALEKEISDPQKLDPCKDLLIQEYFASNVAGFNLSLFLSWLLTSNMI